MGDRCSCTLSIAGILKREHAGELAGALHYADVDGFDDNIEKLTKAILEGQTDYGFSEVNYAEMDPGVYNMLKALRLSFIWHNDEGEAFGAQNEYYDARTGEEAEFPLTGGEICLKISEIDDADRVQAARNWERFEREMTLLVIESNHDLLAQEKKGAVPEGYIDILPLADPAAA